ncbi:MAG: HNH endonuclease signature motif containing protein [Deltaproteobacteria bacterium]
MGALELETPGETRTSWQVAHAALSRLARERAAADAEEGRWLLAAQRSAVHVHLGYGGFSEYIERLFGYKPRSTQEKLRVAQSLEDMPALAQALARGELSWSAVRELTRVAVSETEREWLDFARGKTLRQLEQVLATRRIGDTPRSPPDPSAQRHILRFEVAAETFALFRDALDELRRRTGAALDDDSALLELARSVLAGPRDEGRASYQMVLSVCPECGSGRQHATGGLVPVGPELIRMAHCDAQHVGPLTEQHPLPANDLQPPPGQRQETEDAPGPGESESVSTGSTPSASTIDNPATHVGAGPLPRNTPARPRATQTIPPALRRAVVLRDQRRCQVPGCQNTRWLDLHHLELRSEGGRHSLDNVICLCGSHHRAAHRGQIVLERTPDGRLRVRHADGSEYGGNVDPQLLEVRAKVFSALRHLGFREAEIRAALEQLRRDAALAQAPFDGLLRAALARLRPSGARR